MFVRPSSGWAGMPQTATATLTASDGATGTSVTSVSISGDTVVVAAPGVTANGIRSEGEADVFVEPSSGWASMTQTAKLTASDNAASYQGSGFEFGYSVAISGNTVVVGAIDALVGNNDQGAAYVFVEPTSGWASMTQTAKLIASDGQARDLLGISVSISGNTVVAGAEFAKIGLNTSQGAAYVFGPLALSLPILSPATLPGGALKVAYKQTITASGGTGTITLTVSNIQGAIKGLTVPTSGTGSLTISGTPKATGTETFTVTATDSLGVSASTNYSITINATQQASLLVRPLAAPTTTSPAAGTLLAQANLSLSHKLPSSPATLAPLAETPVVMTPVAPPEDDNATVLSLEAPLSNAGLGQGWSANSQVLRNTIDQFFADYAADAVQG